MVLSVLPFYQSPSLYVHPFEWWLSTGDISGTRVKHIESTVSIFTLLPIFVPSELSA